MDKQNYNVFIYLRKSRADEELENRIGQGETLARHRNALLKLAKERNYNIVNIYEELVSGEELFFRPAMLELLKNIESGSCNAVLVMDMQRLGRGDMEEQGLILKTFKKANVKIITPNKIYDLNNEFDEEYSEFEAFMSRKEYKMINRRMQGGRIRSVEEGNYIATSPPYGYDVIRIDKKTRILQLNQEQAEVIRTIYNWYVNDGLGCGRIADNLNNLGIKSPSGGKWERTSITFYLKNPTYIGKIVWKKKCIKKSKVEGKKKDTYTRDKDEWIISEGKHESIIDIELYEKAQAILAGKYHVPYQLQNGISNVLAGIVVCGICGRKMVRRPYGDKEPHLICLNKCGIKSNKLATVETTILDELEKYLNNIEVNSDKQSNISMDVEINLIQKNINSLQNELEMLESQRLKTFDLLEQGIYDISVFTERSNLLSEKLDITNKAIDTCIKQIKKLKKSNINTDESIKELKYILDAYPKLDNPKDKNLLLKSVLEKVVYYKEKDWLPDNFEITLHHKRLENVDL